MGTCGRVRRSRVHRTALAGVGAGPGVDAVLTNRHRADFTAGPSLLSLGKEPGQCTWTLWIASSEPALPTVVLVDAMPGVRDGLRWVLASAFDVAVAGEAATVAGAETVQAQVVVSGVRLPDGVAADLCGRPVVVHTWLPPDERSALDLAGVAEIVRHGRLRTHLADAIRRAARSH